MGRCEDCGFVFPLDIFNKDTWKCPHCGSRSLQVHRGREFDIDRIEVVREVAEVV